MLIYLQQKATKADLEKARGDLVDPDYIKFVVDINLGVITIGGAKHYDGEQLLLENGSAQHDLWGGGYHLKSKVIDYESMINIRPRDNNYRRDIESFEIREIVKKIFLGIVNG